MGGATSYHGVNRDNFKFGSSDIVNAVVGHKITGIYYSIKLAVALKYVCLLVCCVAVTMKK